MTAEPNLDTDQLAGTEQGAQNIPFARGEIVECVEKPGHLNGITRGKEYVVSDVQKVHSFYYIKILGDDDFGYELLSTMFRRATGAKSP